ncbi:MAG: sigma-54-dependent Fis family transcriptional regulator [Candidatus Eisenbacteria bacterium]|uniref:Sigma-54-dependent Fis family transcriptional regulator n=1 Tax=Eiseniibacteriota bacterium TaxID=2212470 RepID=A0A956NCG9_UNCEI|nr:sigma-54-dependent Fis family transcriptional regulator [Candidatus Eisenbacteria bacterium]
MRLLEGFAFLASVALTHLPDLAKDGEHHAAADKVRELVRSQSGDGALELVGESRTWVEMLYRVSIAQKLDLPVLIEGEPGTGKKLIGRAVATGTDRRKGGPFLTLTCSSLEPEVLEADLFGIGEPGAAIDRPGLVERAKGGTVLLNEIGDAPPEVQRRIGRFMDDGEFFRRGSTRLQRADVRIVATTSKNLRQLVQRGRFRADLYERLDRLRIRVPSLRERSDDAPLLAEHFLRPLGTSIDIEPEARGLLQSHPWPGNVSELEDMMKLVTAVVGDRTTITGGDIAGCLRRHDEEPLFLCPMTLEEARNLTYRNLIIQSHRRHGGDKSKMAEELGVCRMTVYTWISRLGISPDELEGPAPKDGPAPQDDPRPDGDTPPQGGAPPQAGPPPQAGLVPRGPRPVGPRSAGNRLELPKSPE